MRQQIIVASLAGALVLGTGAAAFAHSAPLTDQTVIRASHEQEQTAQPTPLVTPAPTDTPQPTAEPASGTPEPAHATETADPAETADPVETPEPSDQPEHNTEQKDTETESGD